MLQSILPISFELLHLEFICWAIFLTKSLLQPLEEVSFINNLCLQIFLPSESIVLSILEHTVVNVVISLFDSITILVPKVELPLVDHVVRSVESILAVACHLSVLPLALIALPCRHHLFHADTILLIVLELAFVNIPIVEYDLTDSFDGIIVPNTFIYSATLIN